MAKLSGFVAVGRMPDRGGDFDRLRYEPLRSGIARRRDKSPRTIDTRLFSDEPCEEGTFFFLFSLTDVNVRRLA
jgi:hypothetical protein